MTDAINPTHYTRGSVECIDAIEAATGRTAVRNYMDMQPGDVPATWANASLLRRLTGYQPKTSIYEGVAQFVDWYQAYYKVP